MRTGGMGGQVIKNTKTAVIAVTGVKFNILRAGIQEKDVQRARK